MEAKEKLPLISHVAKVISEAPLKNKIMKKQMFWVFI